MDFIWVLPSSRHQIFCECVLEGLGGRVTIASFDPYNEGVLHIQMSATGFAATLVLAELHNRLTQHQRLSFNFLQLHFIAVQQGGRKTSS